MASGKAHLDCMFAFAAAADIRRARAGIGAYSGNVDESLESDSVRQGRNPLGAVHMHGPERFAPMLHIKTDGVYSGVSAGDGRGH